MAKRKKRPFRPIGTGAPTPVNRAQEPKGPCLAHVDFDLATGEYTIEEISGGDFADHKFRSTGLGTGEFNAVEEDRGTRYEYISEEGKAFFEAAWNKIVNESTFPFHMIDLDFWYAEDPKISKVWKPRWGKQVKLLQEAMHPTYSATFYMPPRSLDYLYLVSQTLEESSGQDLSFVLLVCQALWYRLNQDGTLKFMGDDSTILREGPQPKYKMAWSTVWKDNLRYINLKSGPQPMATVSFVPMQLAMLAKFADFQEKHAPEDCDETTRMMISTIPGNFMRIIMDLMETYPNPIEDFPKLKDKPNA